MLSLPPPADFEATTCVDERLVEENMKLFPYLLWMTPRDNRGSRSHSHEDVTATEPGGAQLIDVPPARGTLLRGIGHKGYLGGTALSYAASAGHVAVVRELSLRGVSLDAIVDDRVGRQPLFLGGARLDRRHGGLRTL